METFAEIRDNAARRAANLKTTSINIILCQSGEGGVAQVLLRGRVLGGERSYVGVDFGGFSLKTHKIQRIGTKS